MQLSSPSFPSHLAVANSILPKESQGLQAPALSKVYQLAIAIFFGINLITFVSGICFSVQVLVMASSFSIGASITAFIFHNLTSQNSNEFKRVQEVLYLIKNDLPKAEKLITSVDFWKSLTQEENKKTLLKAWIKQEQLIDLIPFKKLDPSLLILAYEAIKEDPGSIDSLEEFCQRYRCKELIEKMTLQELYKQEGHRLKVLFAKEKLNPEDSKKTKKFQFGWREWREYKPYHAKFILSILMDLHEYPKAEKKRSVNYFVSHLFEKIEEVFFEESETSLFHLLSQANFDFLAFFTQTPNESLQAKYLKFKEKLTS
ncbi:hypothetical protein [Criblamydia sequanensis]|uniref:Membrane protein n=1 Tax=Candidatus Criblamydia sequanensis CRIB-18 TaxID=1437425 RepID=A0A090D1W5_9BACT|nr:hypothetical protein [Criblamydia sequanensis]CDR34130.1 putative membrane protein [Criblamydia sequanensis CRIB-18]